MAALAAQKADDAARAEALYRQVLADHPGLADAWNNLGVLLQRDGRGDEALSCFGRVVDLEPGVARGHTNRGVVLKALGRTDEAIAAYRASLALAPDDDSAHGNLGNLLYDGRRYAEAVPHYAAACRIDPRHAGYRLMHGKALLECGRLAAADVEFAAVLDLAAPAVQKADAWGLRARIRSERHCLAEAVGCFDRGLEIEPDYPALIYNRGLARLLAGDLAGGFADYERRFEVPGFPSRRLAESTPAWRGEALPGRTLFVHAEQGVGDSVQFCRYLPALTRRLGPDARIVFAVQPGLVDVLPAMPGVSIVTHGTRMPPVDAVCPLLSLPHLLGVDRLDLPAPVPYLDVPAERGRVWQERLRPYAGRLRVGIVWAGNPAHSNDANRSMPLAALAPVLRLPNLHWFSLQVGPRAADLARAGAAVVDLSPQLGDYADTAAALTQIDLLVSVDTSVAHLAGALGVPTWLLLPHLPDWRWQLARDDSPWYPALRLFRQPRPGDWDAVARELAAALAPYAAPSAGPAADDLPIADALACAERGEVAAAARLAWATLRRHPFHANAWNLLAVGAWRGKNAAAAALFGARAARFNAGDPANWSNLGAFLKAAGRPDEAVGHLERAVRLAPGDAGAHSNLANALAAAGRLDDAAGEARRAAELAPRSAEFQYNLGVVLREVEDFDGALAAFRRAQALEPPHVRAALHEALLELTRGDFERGWAHYECRWQQPDCQEVRHFNRPQWTGEPIAGRRLLIHAEQGFGDSFQFLRYVPLVAARGAEVVLVVQPSLETFAARLPGVAQLVQSGAALPACDLHCPLLSLPRAFATTLATIPAEVPYLTALPERRDFWRRRLAGLGRYRVGLVWAGRPTHGNDANRSMALARFADLLSDERFDFVSVQKGEATAQIAALPAGCRILDLDAEIGSFDDTAAILGELDELVCVDTSVAHLAGALGVRTRVLLPRLPDWRWLWERSDTPWYPTLTLYRQTTRKIWTEPLARLAADLRQAAEHSGRT